MMVRVSVALIVGSLLAAGPAAAVQTQAPQPAARTGVEVVTVARGLSHPWAMQVLPDGRFLVTERPGTIRIVDKSGRISNPLRGAPQAAARGQGGMLDIALAPDFEKSRQVFISFSESRGGSGLGTSVARAELVSDAGGDRLQNLKVIFRQLPASSSGLHFGSRLAFAPDGKLFVSLGDRGRSKFAQNLEAHYGKIVRINRDGSVPSDNPFAGRSDAQPQIWSFGHRNPQSATIHPGTGKLWTVEHGARGGDEINIPRAGRNYGWPVITYGRDYSGAKIGIGTRKQGLEQPVYYWDPSIAPSGMAFYSADRFPQWKGNLFVGALRGSHLARLVLDGDEVVSEERLIEGERSRIRDVRQGPDGYLYVLTDSRNGRLLRLAPAQ